MSAMSLALLVLALACAVVVYTYVGYPVLLRLLALTKDEPETPAEPATWPRISISMPAYNEAATIRQTIESLLALDYPADRRQIVVVSDASTDGTDAIVSEYAGRGVELVRMASRAGKTAAEQEGARRLTGEIVINTDASIRIAPDAIKKLVRRFADPTVGVASGRDTSVGAPRGGNVTEAGYVGYDMSVRALETRLGTIVGASGCFYAVRLHLHRVPLPESLSRDFASALIAWEHGYRAVSVDDAICLVPRTGSIDAEYRRKVRTITRGVETLWHKRHLLNPVRHPLFAWMLFSHKVCRWLGPWAAAAALPSLAVLATTHAWAGIALAGSLSALGAGALGWALHRSDRGGLLGTAGFVLAGNLAAMHALLRALHGDTDPSWEPTRREPVLETAETA